MIICKTITFKTRNKLHPHQGKIKIWLHAHSKLLATAAKNL